LTLNNANFFFLAALIRCVEWLGRWPYGYWFVQAPPGWWVAGFYVWLALLVTNRRKWLGLAVAPALGVALWLAAPPRDATEITVYDVSKGAAAFVNLPGEQYDFLIDGGDEYAGYRIVVPALRAQGVDRLAAVMLSCADKGHAAGVLKVAANIPVAEAWHAGTRGRSPYYRQWLHEMTAHGRVIREMKAGARWPVAPGTQAEVLHPPATTGSGRAEDNAVVLRLETAGHRVLFLSDASDAVEERLVASGQDLRADVVIREGSGRETLCSESFLASVQPQWVVLQTHSWPPGRPPHPAFTARLAAHKVRLIRTAEAGAVTVRLRQTGISVHSFLPAAAETELESNDSVGDNP
jgi:competence protein ComEC